MSTKFASRHTNAVFTATGSAGELTVASGGAVQVCGMLFTCGGSGASVFTITNDGTTALFTVQVGANASFELSIPWLADDGLRVQVDQTTGAPEVTVYHNSPGV